ncbi:hypothetical protein [Candidatus Amarolinea dominans]|uniref:hypothetical protein n=1 Tax=Candidatus Amarolinea dominans TaxID=3140696 RepID=UPI003134F566|nr:hypothetical protein [Anaerolineae bacterium]
MSANDRARADDLFDLLADEVTARLAARATAAAAAATAALRVPPPAAPLTPLPPAGEAEPTAEQEAVAQETLAVAMPVTATGASHLIRRLALGLLVIIVLINLPLNRHGASLARALPGSAALVIRDGLVVKEADKDTIYVFRDEQFHWISSLDAFEHFSYRWQQVRCRRAGLHGRLRAGRADSRPPEVPGKPAHLPAGKRPQALDRGHRQLRGRGTRLGRRALRGLRLPAQHPRRRDHSTGARAGATAVRMPPRLSARPQFERATSALLQMACIIITIRTPA